MNLQHVVKINHRLHEITRTNATMLTLGAGKQRAVYYIDSARLVSKHVLNGRYIATGVK